MVKTNSDKIEMGDKKRAGQLLSSLIRTIMQEKTTYANAGTTEIGDVLIMTKAEAMARQIVDRALGDYVYLDEKTQVWKRPNPDKSMIELIYERMEGRVGTQEEEKKKQADIPKEVSRLNKNALNAIATKEKENAKRVLD